MVKGGNGKYLLIVKLVAVNLDYQGLIQLKNPFEKELLVAPNSSGQSRQNREHYLVS